MTALVFVAAAGWCLAGSLWIILGERLGAAMREARRDREHAERVENYLRQEIATRCEAQREANNLRRQLDAKHARIGAMLAGHQTEAR